jgi:hypothetical protein
MGRDRLPSVKCSNCGKDILFGEGYDIEGPSGWSQNAGEFSLHHKYCEECYQKIQKEEPTSPDKNIPKLTEKDIKELRYLLISWEDNNISDFEYCNSVGGILGLGKWTCKGLKK